MLRNVSDDLAQAVAQGLGIPLPKAMPRLVEPPPAEVEVSPALSLTFRPGDGNIRGRKIAVLLAPGVDRPSVTEAQAALTKAGAVVRLVAARLGPVAAADGNEIEPDATLETFPSVLFDAVVVPDGKAAADELSRLGHALEFVKDQYRHGKAILATGAARKVLEGAGVLADPADWALTDDLSAFAKAVGRHRNWDRAVDPPRV
jgi:catalase